MSQFNFSFVVDGTVVSTTTLDLTLNQAYEKAQAALLWADAKPNRKVTAYGVGMFKREVVSKRTLDTIATRMQERTPIAPSSGSYSAMAAEVERSLPKGTYSQMFNDAPRATPAGLMVQKGKARGEYDQAPMPKGIPAIDLALNAYNEAKTRTEQLARGQAVRKAMKEAFEAGHRTDVLYRHTEWSNTSEQVTLYGQTRLVEPAVAKIEADYPYEGYGTMADGFQANGYTLVYVNRSRTA